MISKGNLKFNTTKIDATRCIIVYINASFITLIKSIHHQPLNILGSLLNIDKIIVH